MSQFIVFNPTGPAGGGPILTLTADNAVAVSPLAGNINILGDGLTISTSGNNGTHAITISATGTQVATVQTVDATQTTLDTITLAANEVVLINTQVIGAYQAATNSAIGGDFTVLARKQGAGNAAIVQLPVPLVDIQTAGTTSSITLDANGNTIRIRVTGEAGTTINWKSVTTIVRQVAP